MFKKMKYETPEIEITKFEVSKRIMDGNLGGGSNGDDGDEETTAYEMSTPDASYPWPYGADGL